MDVNDSVCLAISHPPEKEHGDEFYEPLSAYTGIFKTFARLGMKNGALLTSKAIARNQDAVLNFANKYGLLGEYDDYLKTIDVEGKIYRMESLDGWVESISKISHAVALWLAIQRNDKSFIRKNIAPAKAKEAFSYRSEYFGIQISKELFKAIEHEYTPAEYVLRELVNQNFSNSSRTIMVKKCGKYELLNMPKHLLGAMWLQFAQAIAGNRKYKTCEWCGIEFDATVFRSDRKTCSDSCRVQLSRSMRGKQP